MSMILIVVIAVFFLVGILALACCKVAGDADARAEELCQKEFANKKNKQLHMIEEERSDFHA